MLYVANVMFLLKSSTFSSGWVILIVVSILLFTLALQENSKEHFAEFYAVVLHHVQTFQDLFTDLTYRLVIWKGLAMEMQFRFNK